jgi:hypothetical protein
MEHHQKQIDPAVLAEQKAYKASKESFRATIKQLAEAQKSVVKLQRRTVRDIGLPLRTMNPDVAASTHRLNRWELRHLHIAYALFRGKAVSERYYVLAYGTGTVTVGRIDGKPISRIENAPDPTLILKLLKQHVQKSTVKYPTQETETVRDSPSGYGGC